ncbi:MAG: hypothetical protein FJ304_21280 [Planctomycetes bacterium]|nr:hypothetical protein [Planctomycetota bacterium]
MELTATETAVVTAVVATVVAAVIALVPLHPLVVAAVAPRTRRDVLHAAGVHAVTRDRRGLCLKHAGEGKEGESAHPERDPRQPTVEGSEHRTPLVSMKVNPLWY